MLTVHVKGVDIHFLVDSGATQSLIKHECLPRAPLSGKTVHSTGASGQVTPEPVTKPLNLIDPFTGQELTHQFLLSPVCPINLLARDLMLKMSLCLKCTPEGIQVVKQTETTTFSKLPKLLYIFEWSIADQQTETILRLARNRVPPTADVMPQQRLHCTTLATTDPADELGDEFICSPPTSLHVTHMCWQHNTTFLLVCLSPAQQHFFQVPESFPHISLAKDPADKWKSLGPLAKSTHEATDWMFHSPGIKYSPSLQMYREQLIADLSVRPSKEVIDDSS